MDTHKNAPLTPKGREVMVRSVIEGGLTKAAAALQFNVTAKTVAKWLKRFRAEGVDGLRDRSSRPHSLPSQTPPATCAAVATLRRRRYIGKQIAAEVGISPATVSRILRRLGLNRMRDLEPAGPVRRYERDHPGELIHIDIKKLGKFNRVGHRITGDRTGQSNLRARGEGPGWEYVHVCIDDASRIAFSRVMKSERQGCAVAFLKAAIAYYASLGIKVERVMTDNGSCYKSLAFRKACNRLGLKHIRTKPYTPQTNGKAERFIQTSLREWAYARAYSTSQERAAELPGWLHRYNWHRPHGGIGSSQCGVRLPPDQLIAESTHAANYRTARADVANRGVRQWYLIGIRTSCNTYLDEIRIAHDQELQGEICRADPSGPHGPEGFPGKSR